jgi:ABC-2 type transport system permease protein
MRAALATLRAAMAEVRANRASFRVQVGVMILNDLAWVAFWGLFFNRVGTVRGWDLFRVLLLYAVLTVAGGLVLGVFANARRLGSIAAEGGLDAALSLPVTPLAHVLVRRIEPTNLGDLVFGVAVFVLAGGPTPGRAAMFLVVSLAGAVVLLGFLVTVGSLAFFTGRAEPGELGFNAIVALASYPADILTGSSRLLVHTVIPAAFVATVPATLVDQFDLRLALALAGAAVVSAGAGWAVFTIGLRRYASGSIWTRA